jgi:hypothetical protein
MHAIGMRAESIDDRIDLRGRYGELVGELLAQL